MAFGNCGEPPSVTLTAVLSLALGIGGTTIVFSVVYGVLIRPLPYEDADRLVRVSEWHPGGTPLALGWTALSSVTYHAWNGHSRTADCISPAWRL